MRGKPSSRPTLCWPELFVQHVGHPEKRWKIPYIPSWIGFLIDLNKNLTVKPSTVWCLDCLDAPATKISTVSFMKETSHHIKDQLQLKSIVCVYDQAIYTKVHQIKSKEPPKFKDIFLMKGTFHIILTFLAVIAAWFKDAGLWDIVAEGSNIVAEGSVDVMFIVSRGYKRAIWVYKITYKAFSKILLKNFEDAHTSWYSSYNAAVHRRSSASMTRPYTQRCTRSSAKNQLNSKICSSWLVLSTSYWPS